MGSKMVIIKNKVHSVSFIKDNYLYLKNILFLLFIYYSIVNKYNKGEENPLK